LAKLPTLTGKEVVKIIEKFGFYHDHTTGSHMIYKHPDGRKTTIPNRTGEEIGPGLLNKIIKKDLGITRKEFFAVIIRSFGAGQKFKPFTKEDRLHSKIEDS
jgi:predicted RNA binding protein YcfA (HicA-like mRNA interferase family)